MNFQEAIKNHCLICYGESHTHINFPSYLRHNYANNMTLLRPLLFASMSDFRQNR